MNTVKSKGSCCIIILWKHPESEGCHFYWLVCDDMFVMIWVWPRVTIYHMFQQRWSAVSLPREGCDFKYVFWMSIFWCICVLKCLPVWVENRSSGTLSSIRAFIGFLWPGHKDSCGRQQRLWYRAKHTMNLSIFGQTVATEHSCRKLYQPCMLTNHICSHGYGYYSDIAFSSMPSSF